MTLIQVYGKNYNLIDTKTKIMMIKSNRVYWRGIELNKNLRLCF